MEGSTTGQVRHESVTTTHAVRAAIKRSQASLSQLSQELGINLKTVAKWRKRATVEEMKTGPTEPRSTVLTEPEDAAIVALRRHSLLPLDACLYALQPSIPHLTRSALHRCLQRHSIRLMPPPLPRKARLGTFRARSRNCVCAFCYPMNVSDMNERAAPASRAIKSSLVRTFCKRRQSRCLRRAAPGKGRLSFSSNTFRL